MKFRGVILPRAEGRMTRRIWRARFPAREIEISHKFLLRRIDDVDRRKFYRAHGRAKAGVPWQK